MRSSFTLVDLHVDLPVSRSINMVSDSRCVWRIFLHTSMKIGRELHLHFHLNMHVRRHTGCHGYKMAPVVELPLEQEDDLPVGGCFDFRARFA